jgi:hypothetical protein
MIQGGDFTAGNGELGVGQIHVLLLRLLRRLQP